VVGFEYFTIYIHASSDGDVHPEVVPFRNYVIERDVPSSRIPHTIVSSPSLSRSLPFRMGAGIVLRVDDDCGFVPSQIGYDISPSPIIVYTERDDEILARIRSKSEGTRSAASTHSENLVRDVDSFSPSTAICVVPNSLFDNLETGVKVPVNDLRVNSIRHDFLLSVELETDLSA